jgi:glycosyltransferase involved in cell wall biosynthesis
MHAERGFDRPMTHLPPFSARRDEEWRVPGPRPHPRPYFLYVGRLEILKGVRALADVWDRVPDADLVFVGDGSQRAELEALAARNPRIVVHGPMPPDALGPHYVHAIACVVPSLVYEVAPTVVLEAFARKTPVVARDLGGTSELAGEGGGILYTTDDELVAALAGLAASPETRAALAEVGYAAFERRWTTAVHLAAYLRLIDEVAEQKAGGPRRQAAGEREDR